MLDLGNLERGVSIASSGNTIGGTTALERNVISGNNIQGIMINGSGATGNTVEGNYIGTNILGSGPVANTGAGIFLGNSANNNTIGGLTANERNVISGNSGDGIQTSNTTGLIVTGNYIGTNAAGTAALANGADGISLLYNVDSAIIGGATANHRNVISGNTSDGVSVIDATSSGNLIQGNYIGTDYTGMLDVGNTVNGVVINGATSTTIDANLISGNNGYGIYVGNVVANGTVITGNMIGLDAAGGQTDQLARGDRASKCNVQQRSAVPVPVRATSSMRPVSTGEYCVASTHRHRHPRKPDRDGFNGNVATQWR